MDTAHPSFASLFGMSGQARADSGFHGSPAAGSRLNEISGKLFLEHAQRMSPGSVQDPLLFSPLKHLHQGLKRPHPSSRHNSCSPQPLPLPSPVSSVHSSSSQMTGPPAEFLARLTGNDEGASGRGRSASPLSSTTLSMDGSHACVQCSASFPTRDLLDKHEMLHSPNGTVVSGVVFRLSCRSYSPVPKLVLVIKVFCPRVY